MPVIVTNQVRFHGGPGGQETAFTSAGNMLKTNAQLGYPLKMISLSGALRSKACTSCLFYNDENKNIHTGLVSC